MRVAFEARIDIGYENTKKTHMIVTSTGIYLVGPTKRVGSTVYMSTANIMPNKMIGKANFFA
jgi:hypothetical protein